MTNAPYFNKYAKVFISNLTAMVVNVVQKQVDPTTFTRKHIYQINFSQVFFKMKNTVIELLLFSTHKLWSKLAALIDDMATQ